jgi:predicted PurR-regulated permease PerM
MWVALSQSKRVVWVLVAAAIVLLVGSWAFQALGSFLFLLLLAWLLSIAMEPGVAWLIRRGMSRALASAVVLFGLMAVTVGVGAMFGQVFVAQAQELKDAFPEAVRQAVAWVNGTFDTSFNTDQIYAALQLTPEKVAELAQRFGGGLLGVFGALVTFVFNLVTILVFAYYLSADSIKLRQTIGSYLPPRYQPMLMTIWTIAVEKTGGYVVSKVILATISSAAYAVFFLIINVPFWLPLGVLMGIIAQFVPIIGTYIGVLLPALFAIVEKPFNALWIVLFATVYQQLENYWFTPKVSKRTMDIHPAVALASVFVGVGLFGPIGAIIGIPVAAAALTILDTFRNRHDLLPELESLVEEPEEGHPGTGAGSADTHSGHLGHHTHHGHPMHEGHSRPGAASAPAEPAVDRPTPPQAG